MVIAVKNSGFSLIELSVTLVIAGLLAAGITSGMHLMQSAKIDKMVSEITGFNTAFQNFRLKYNAWPGDMPNAVTYWGTYAFPATPEGTVNGDGNERISGNLTEALRATQQLALSGTITGHYTGVTAGATDSWQVDVNMPGTGYAESGHYLFQYFTSVYATNGNALQLGATTSGNTDPYGAALKAADVFAVDVKIDDGSTATAGVASGASTGNIYAARSTTYAATAGACTDNPISSASANYVLTDDVVDCRLMLWLNKE
jgi:prepilin-type N-terminal cleavage/methylation domain-containing protein